MRKFEVGKLFEEGKIRYPEGIKFDFDQSGPFLIMFFNNPSSMEIQSVRKGDLEFKLCVMDGVIFILYKFDGMQWMDAPYNVHLSPEFDLEGIAQGKGFGLNIFLVDADTGILEGMRYVGLSAEFSRRLKTSIQKQAALPFDKIAYHQSINRIYGNYSTNDLIKYSIARCKIRQG